MSPVIGGEMPLGLTWGSDAFMHAVTLDHISKGRLILGLGVSGPQVVEGWYGRPSRQPLARTREYVEILRRVFRREGPLEFEAGVNVSLRLGRVPIGSARMVLVRVGRGSGSCCGPPAGCAARSR